MKSIFENYETFYVMLASSMMLGNKRSELLVSNQRKVIDFIGKAYDLDDDKIAKYTKIITDDLTDLESLDDAKASFITFMEKEEGDLRSLRNLKAEIIFRFNGLNKNYIYPWLDYQYQVEFKPEIAFHRVHQASRDGLLIACRETGLMHVLGIGTDVNFERGILRLRQAALWGDIPSLHLLSKAYELNNNLESSKLYKEIAELSNEFLNQGITILPEEIKKNYERAHLEYALISSLYQDVIRDGQRENYIDYSFVEVLMLDSLDYYAKMKYINNYAKYEWREETNSSFKKYTNKIGF